MKGLLFQVTLNKFIYHFSIHQAMDVRIAGSAVAWMHDTLLLDLLWDLPKDVGSLAAEDHANSVFYLSVYWRESHITIFRDDESRSMCCRLHTFRFHQLCLIIRTVDRTLYV